jgi:microcystin-dependent protein
MSTITGFTAARMLEIEDSTVVDARVESGDLILIQHDGTENNVGSVAGPAGPQGPPGPPGLSSIPGEVKLWPGGVLPDPEDYGTWVWANGNVYVVADHPLAAGHIATAWRTFDGASDPGAGNFRVPDMRGLVPAGLDQMPAGTRANRMTRAAAIILASKTGKETHALVLAELAAHGHVVDSHSHGGVVAVGGAHAHLSRNGFGLMTRGTSGDAAPYTWGTAGTLAYSDNSTDTHGGHQHVIPAEAPGTNSQGGNGAHETVQPTVMVPYIVHLDGVVGGGA